MLPANGLPIRLNQTAFGVPGQVFFYWDQICTLYPTSASSHSKLAIFHWAHFEVEFFLTFLINAYTTILSSKSIVLRVTHQILANPGETINERKIPACVIDLSKTTSNDRQISKASRRLPKKS